MTPMKMKKSLLSTQSCLQVWDGTSLGPLQEPALVFFILLGLPCPSWCQDARWQYKSSDLIHTEEMAQRATLEGQESHRDAPLGGVISGILDSPFKINAFFSAPGTLFSLSLLSISMQTNIGPFHCQTTLSLVWVIYSIFVPTPIFKLSLKEKTFEWRQLSIKIPGSRWF